MSYVATREPRPSHIVAPVFEQFLTGDHVHYLENMWALKPISGTGDGSGSHMASLTVVASWDRFGTERPAQHQFESASGQLKT